MPSVMDVKDKLGWLNNNRELEDHIGISTASLDLFGTFKALKRAGPRAELTLELDTGGSHPEGGRHREC